MTHHQIPNEICIWKSQMIEFLDRRRKEVAIGVNQDNYNGALYYTRTDVFIEKAKKYLEEYFINEVSVIYGGPVVIQFNQAFENFIKYMKGE